MNRKWKKIWMVAALLGSVAGAAEPAPQPVLVRFENLAWVGAKTVLPFVADGKTYVPPAEACDLLGLTCTIGKDSLSVGGQTLPLVPVTVIEQAGRQTVSVTPLSPLVKLSGQNLVWDAGSRAATVSGGSGSRGWRYARDYLGEPRNVYAGPLRASRSAVVRGRPTVEQLIFATQPLQEFSLFSKSGGSLNIVGSQRPSSPDVPNKFTGCEGKTTCSLPVPRDALWTLALVTVK